MKNKEQYVIRNTVRNNFTTFSNDLLRDENLSWRARGILVYMLSMPEDWVFYESEIMKHSKKEGRDAFRTAMKELKENGYVRKEAIKDEKGKIVKWATYVNSEKPYDINEDQESQITENPECGESVNNKIHITENPECGLPTKRESHNVDNPTLQSTYISTKNLSEPSTNNTNEAKSDIEKQFEEFWSLYPRKANKKQAIEKFNIAVKQHGYENIINGVNNYITEIQIKKTDKKFIKYPATFLYNECYLEEFITTGGNNYGSNNQSAKQHSKSEYSGLSI